MAFWVDELTDSILEKYKQDSFLINDSLTPSGHGHIGSLRGVILHDIVTDDIADKKKSAVFQYGIDDFDPMDGLPVYVDESFRKYMGLPLCNVPAPDGQGLRLFGQFSRRLDEILGIHARSPNRPIRGEPTIRRGRHRCP